MEAHDLLWSYSFLIIFMALDLIHSFVTTITIISRLHYYRLNNQLSDIVILCLSRKLEKINFNFVLIEVDSGVEGFAGLDPDSIQEIISEVYANNHEELAPCLDGLGAEALQPSSATDLNAFTHISFQGTGSGNDCYQSYRYR